MIGLGSDRYSTKGTWSICSLHNYRTSYKFLQMTLKTGYEQAQGVLSILENFVGSVFFCVRDSKQAIGERCQKVRQGPKERRRTKLPKVKVESFLLFCSRSLKYARKCDWTGSKERRRWRTKLPKRLRPFVRFSDSQIGQQSQLT